MTTQFELIQTLVRRAEFLAGRNRHEEAYLAADRARDALDRAMREIATASHPINDDAEE